MKDLFTYDIWCWLRDTLGFKGAVAFLYIGLFITVCAAMYYIPHVLIRWYKEDA